MKVKSFLEKSKIIKEELNSNFLESQDVLDSLIKIQAINETCIRKIDLWKLESKNFEMLQV